MNIYISSSWKNRDRVRALAISLRENGHQVYDFTDPDSRKMPEIPPEKFPDAFDPEKHLYREYLNVPEWKAAVQCNREALDRCDAVVLLLPCGNDAHADWAYAVGKGKWTAVVGQPRKGERTPSHWWTDAFLDSDLEVAGWLECEESRRTLHKLRAYCASPTGVQFVANGEPCCYGIVVTPYHSDDCVNVPVVESKQGDA